MTRRITRANRRSRTAVFRSACRRGSEFSERLGAVLHVLHLVSQQSPRRLS
jgi:predicted RNA polymerase sigma factor